MFIKKSAKNYDFTKQNVEELDKKQYEQNSINSNVTNIIDKTMKKELKKEEFKKQIEDKMSVVEERISTKNGQNSSSIIGLLYENILKHLPYNDAIEAFKLFPEEVQKNNIVQDYIKNNKTEKKIETPKLTVKSPEQSSLIPSCFKNTCISN